MQSIFAIALLLAASAGIIAVVGACRRRLSDEASRKLVHVGMGLLLLGCPWLFNSAWPVMSLALLYVAGAWLCRACPPLRERIWPVIRGADRRGAGEVYFPVTIAAVFWMAGGDRILYCVPILLLTLADSAAALVGRRYGRCRLGRGEMKTVEGSAAFFVVAFLSVHVPLLLSGAVSPGASLMIGAAVGLLVAGVEAVSVAGMDNAAVPLTAFGILWLVLNAR